MAFKVLTVAGIGSMITTLAQADCSTAILQEKVLQISTQAQALAISDPTKMQEVMSKLHETSAKMATATADNLQPVCDTIDGLLASLEQ